MSIIVFEGIDCSGKNTVADLVAKAINAERVDFPHEEDSETGPVIREYLQGKWHVATPDPWDKGSGFSKKDSHRSAMALQALFAANRYELLEQLRRYRGPSGPHLVVVRYWQSGWVYGQLDKQSRTWLEAIHRPLLELAPATANFWLDIPAELAYQRRMARDGDRPPELYEGSVKKLNAARELYRELWTERSEMSPMLWQRIDAARPLSVVVEEAMRPLTILAVRP